VDAAAYEVDVIDTHVHLASDDLGTYPHAERPPFETASYVHTADDLLSSMRQAAVRQATIVQPFGLYGMDNSYHADAAQRHPAEFVGICGIATTSEGADALRYWVQERGMVGARIMTLGQGVSLNDDGFTDVCRTAASLDIPVCLLTSRKHVLDLPGLATRVPTVRLVLDHLGWSGPVEEPTLVTERLSPLVATDNVFLKVTTPLLASGEHGLRVMEFILERFGPSRIIWGTNYPMTDLGGYASTVQVSREALSFLSRDEQDWVCRRTALDLWPKLTADATSDN
jgi:predicted TIM-barrel fold metal-dependent hydrolase